MDKDKLEAEIKRQEKRLENAVETLLDPPEWLVPWKVAEEVTTRLSEGYGCIMALKYVLGNMED